MHMQMQKRVSNFSGDMNIPDIISYNAALPICKVYKDHFTVLSLQSLHCESLRSGLLQWWWTTWNTKKIISTLNILIQATMNFKKKTNTISKFC